MTEVSVMQTGAGSIESVNADFVHSWAIEEGHAYLVCDGIVHTEETREAVIEFAEKLSAEDWCYVNDREMQLSGNVLKAIDCMSPHHDGRAFCCSIILIFDGYYVAGWCGDCRIGNVTLSALEWLTTDDVPFLKMYQDGVIDYEFYLKSRHLLSCKLKVGQNNIGCVKTFSGTLANCKNLILCSDGFWSEVNLLNESIKEHFSVEISNEVNRLARDGIDNFSVIVLDV